MIVHPLHRLYAHTMRSQHASHRRHEHPTHAPSNSPIALYMVHVHHAPANIPSQHLPTQHLSSMQSMTVRGVADTNSKDPGVDRSGVPLAPYHRLSQALHSGRHSRMVHSASGVLRARAPVDDSPRRRAGRRNRHADEESAGGSHQRDGSIAA